MRAFLRTRFLLALALTAGLACWVQQTPAQQSQPKPNVPDAPSAVKPPQQFPTDAPRTTTPPARQPGEPTGESSSTGTRESESTSAAPPAEGTVPAPPPGPTTTTAGPSRPTPRTADDDTRNQIFTLTTNVNFVFVPVTVKDNNGRMVDGLLKHDFVIMEDGTPQTIQFFTSDPLPISAAIVVDVGMSDLTLRKVQESINALSGAFSQFDEVSVFTYASTVQKIGDFTPAATPQFEAELRKVQYVSGSQRRTGQQGGVPFAGGPLNNTSPVINGRNVDPNAPIVPVVQPEPRVLNDALLAAANELAARDRARRRILFVISDGREQRSRARYQDVLKVLLSHEITVYALAVGDSAIPIYGTAQKMHIPGTGYGDILPKYCSATGGGVTTEFTRKGIEEAYAVATEQARNQYTLGYTTRATAASNYREIEVRVHRPNLKIFAKTGYYPLPPQRGGAPAAAPTAPKQ